MRLQRFVLLAAAFGAVAACDDKGSVTTTNTGQLAFVRYVHAMNDTGVVDVRVVDKAENLYCYNQPYRAICPYQGVEAGTRHFRVFTSSTTGDINLVTQVIHDETLTLEAGKYYTILHTGFARTGQTPAQKFCLIEDVATAPSAGKFKIRAIVAAPFGANQDVYVTRATNATSAPAPGAGATPLYTATDAGTACPTATAWVEVDTVPLARTANPNGGSATLFAYNAGTAVPAAANASATVFPGDTVKGVSSAVPGSRISGSVLTAFLFPAGVAGSPAAGASTVAYAVDKRP